MNRNRIWNGKPWQAFKTFAIIFSFVMNFILLIVLLMIAPLLLPILSNIAGPIVGGLNDSFVDMSTATIEQTIVVQDEIPISFTLPLATETAVKITEDVSLAGVPAQFVLPNGGGSINGRVFLDLPANLELPVELALEVPVDQTIPVELAVDVAIPLSETELGGPFNQLQALFAPLNQLIDGLPRDNDELFQRISESGQPGAQTTAVLPE